MVFVYALDPIDFLDAACPLGLALESRTWEAYWHQLQTFWSALTSHSLYEPTEVREGPYCMVAPVPGSPELQPTVICKMQNNGTTIVASNQAPRGKDYYDLIQVRRQGLKVASLPASAFDPPILSADLDEYGR